MRPTPWLPPWAWSTAARCGLNGTAAVLALVAAALVGAVVAEASGDRRLAALAAAGAWVWSYAAVWNSVRENGFRQLVLCAGLVLVLCSLRIQRGRAPAAAYAGLGLAAGLGWWASPEIAYFVVPAVVLLVAGWDRLYDPGGWRAAPLRPGPVLVAGAGAVLGALPWLYTNLGDGFASLHPGSLPSTPGQGYGQRLGVFFHAMLPIQLGVRTVPGGAWVGGPVIGPVLYGLVAAVLAVAAVGALAGARRGRRAAPLLASALAVLAFPLIYAAVPSSGYWVDGRYGVLFPALAVVLAALALAGPARAPQPAAPDQPPVPVADARRHRPDGQPTRRAPTPRASPGPAVAPGRGGAHARRRPGGRWGTGRRSVLGRGPVWVGCAGLVGLCALTVLAGRAGGVPARPSALLAGWSDANGPGRQVAAAMAAHHLRDAYGDYWTAYTLDFLDPGQLTVSPSPADVVRWPAMAGRVARSSDPAWLFFAPGQRAAAAAAFSNPEPGPGGYTEAQFEALLRGRGVGYRVVHLGVLDAVVPAHRVTLPVAGG